MDERRSGGPGNVALICRSMGCGRERLVHFPTPDRELCGWREDYTTCDLCGGQLERMTPAEIKARLSIKFGDPAVNS